MLAPPATDMDAKLVSNGRQAALQRADDAGRYAGGVPVHTHDGAERLEPEGMRQPSQELITAIMMHDSLADDCAQSCHSLCQPWRYASAMQGKIRPAAARDHVAPNLTKFAICPQIVRQHGASKSCGTLARWFWFFGWSGRNHGIDLYGQDTESLARYSWRTARPSYEPDFVSP